MTNRVKRDLSLSVLLFASTLPLSAATLRVPQNFVAIQNAVIAATPGDTIEISPGIYSEKVLIEKSDIRLVAVVPAGGTVPIVEGTGLVGIGIHVRGTTAAPVSNVQIVGLIVRNFERGIVLENATLSRVQSNEAAANVDKDSVLDLGDGIVLIGSRNNEVIDNSSHDNGHDGIMLNTSSAFNVIRANRIRDNGFQRSPSQGCSIELAGPGSNNNNTIIDNDIPAGHWGIRIGPGGSSSGNLVARNRVTGHVRAGLVTRGPSQNNLFIQNDATGNGTGAITPTFSQDLFDDSTGSGNTYLNNKGRRALYIAVAGKVTGALGQRFVSDLRLTNGSSAQNAVTVDYFPATLTGATAPAATAQVSISPGTESVINDVLASLFATSGVGALRLIADQNIAAASRVFTDNRASNGGTFGQGVPPIENLCGAGTLPMLSNASSSDIANAVGFRTNIGYFNPNTTTVTATFTAKSNDGITLGTKIATVPGLSWRQAGAFDLIDTVPASDRAQNEFFLTYSTTGGPLIVYSSVIDNKTGDGTYTSGICSF